MADINKQAELEIRIVPLVSGMDNHFEFYYNDLFKGEISLINDENEKKPYTEINETKKKGKKLTPYIEPIPINQKLERPRSLKIIKPKRCSIDTSSSKLKSTKLLRRIIIK